MWDPAIPLLPRLLQHLLLQAGRHRAGMGKAFQAKPKTPRHRQEVCPFQLGTAGSLLQCAPAIRNAGGNQGMAALTRGKQPKSEKQLSSSLRIERKCRFLSSALPFIGQTAPNVNVAPLCCASQVGSWLVHLKTKLRFSRLRNSSRNTNPRAPGPLPMSPCFTTEGAPFLPRALCSALSILSTPILT